MKFARTLVAALFLVAMVPAGLRCQQPADAGNATTRLENLLDSGKYDEALGLSDKGLKENPDSPDFGYFKVRSLMGLGRFMEAARIVLPLAGKYPGRPEFRFLAGQCALDMGLVPQAVQTWSALYTNKAWADVAYRRSGRALG
jgi:tetratricopeptide (TPR) repeat protein